MMTPKPRMEIAPVRLRLVVCGAVQGVGFRPCVYRLANELGLTGWVNNSAQGVTIEVEGHRVELEQFRQRLTTEKPPRSFIQSCEATWLDLAGYDGFVIRASETHGGKTALVLPDIATCPDCLCEILDPANRRHRYPFTNCTNCGPRFSIIEALPYDRANTSMRSFQMCPACQAEYDDPNDRRFHAQPNACPVCGPQLEVWPGGATGANSGPPRRLAHGNDALLAAAHVIRSGQIVAVKGIGGFHLLVDARNETAVQRLRERKQREEKPFALLFPTWESVTEDCEVSSLEERLLRSPEAPIVLLKKRSVGVMEYWSADVRSTPHSGTPALQHSIATSVAPGNPNLGVMLPSNPLHHLLMAELGFPVVATSGNLSDEPICTDEFEALERLRGIADIFLVHNRPIVRHMDDSIVRVMMDREMVLRRARGFAPLPITLKSETQNRKSEIVLAVGAHLKNSVALAVGDQVFLSQHLGDLETEQAHEAFCRAADDLPRLYDVQPEFIAADLHPDYLSTQFALERVAQASLPASSGGIPAARSHTEQGCSVNPQAGSLRHVGVQHHLAHVLSCLAENEVALPALGVAWDGTGLGTDGTIWGGEFFLVTDQTVTRVAHWRPFRLPGGDAAAKEPRRAAWGLIYELVDGDTKLLLHMQQTFGNTLFSNCLGFAHVMLSAESMHRGVAAWVACLMRWRPLSGCGRRWVSRVKRRWNWSSPPRMS
jgi:hydrogenase maturation protein HypF